MVAHHRFEIEPKKTSRSCNKSKTQLNLNQKITKCVRSKVWTQNIPFPLPTLFHHFFNWILLWITMIYSLSFCCIPLLFWGQRSLNLPYSIVCATLSNGSEEQWTKLHSFTPFDPPIGVFRFVRFGLRVPLCGAHKQQKQSFRVSEVSWRWRGVGEWWRVL